MEIISYDGIIINPSIFGPCPNDEWDHYVEFTEVKRRGRPKGSKNKIKKWFNNLFN